MSDLKWFKSSYSDASGGECVEVAHDWRKSSYSDAGGGECVEVAHDWHKSSFSDSTGGQCVEVAVAPSRPAIVHIRDSKAPEGPTLDVCPDAFAAFISFAARA